MPRLEKVGAVLWEGVSEDAGVSDHVDTSHLVGIEIELHLIAADSPRCVEGLSVWFRRVPVFVLAGRGVDPGKSKRVRASRLS